MDIPNLTRLAVASHVNVERLETAIKTIEDGLAAKHIWNADYVTAKDTISRAWENTDDVAHDYLTNMYYRGNDVFRTWQDNDPRFNMGLCGFLNTPGWLAKLKKVNAPELADYIAVIEEVAALAEMVKAVKPYIEKGRKPSENPKEVDYTNTGICPVCMKRQKLNFDGTLVAHGYTIPRGWGGRNGMCMGRGYKAWELAPDGAIAFKRVMVQQLAEEKERLEIIQSDKLPVLMEQVQVRKSFGRYETETKKYDRGTPDYERVKRSSIFSIESNIRYLTADIEAVGIRIDNWKAEPLKYGGAETQERWKSKLLKKESK